MFFVNRQRGQKKMLFCNLAIESQTTIVCWASNGYLSTRLYKQTVIHWWMNKNKQILSLPFALSPERFFYFVWPAWSISGGDYTISIWSKKKTNVSLPKLCLLKFSSRISNWTRTTHSIKQHGTHCGSPIKYIALANYDSSNSSCLFSFYGQIWLKKRRKKNDWTHHAIV